MLCSGVRLDADGAERARQQLHHGPDGIPAEHLYVFHQPACTYRPASCSVGPCPSSLWPGFIHTFQTLEKVEGEGRVVCWGGGGGVLV